MTVGIMSVVGAVAAVASAARRSARKAWATSGAAAAKVRLADVSVTCESERQRR